MKMMKKLASLLLVLVMSLVLAVPCFAAEETPTFKKVYHLENGITVTVGLGGEMPMMPRGGIYGSTNTSAARVQQYNMIPSEGSTCTAHIFNDSDDAKSGVGVRVTYKVLVNGESVNCPSFDAINQPAFIEVKDNNGNGLSGYIKETITPINAPVVPYTYRFVQK